MFRRKPSWQKHSFQALLFAGLVYKFARLFMKSAEGLARQKPAGKGKAINSPRHR